jgi:hypothetical protein
MLRLFDHETQEFLNYLEETAWGYDAYVNNLKTISTTTQASTNITATSTKIISPPWSDGMLDTFEGLSSTCGPYSSSPTVAIRSIEHLHQWLKTHTNNISNKRDKYRLTLLRQGHILKRRKDGCKTNNGTKPTTATAAGKNARKRSEILEREEEREEYKCMLLENTIHTIYAQSICHVLGGCGMLAVDNNDDGNGANSSGGGGSSSSSSDVLRQQLKAYSETCVHPSVSLLINRAVGTIQHSNNRMLCNTWGMIIGLLSRGSLSLIMHHILDNRIALGIDKWDEKGNAPPLLLPMNILKHLNTIELWINTKQRLQTTMSYINRLFDLFTHVSFTEYLLLFSPATSYLDS